MNEFTDLQKTKSCWWWEISKAEFKAPNLSKHETRKKWKVIVMLNVSVYSLEDPSYFYKTSWSNNVSKKNFDFRNVSRGHSLILALILTSGISRFVVKDKFNAVTSILSRPRWAVRYVFQRWRCGGHKMMRYSI